MSLESRSVGAEGKDRIGTCVGEAGDGQWRLGWQEFRLAVLGGGWWLLHDIMIAAVVVARGWRVEGGAWWSKGELLGGGGWGLGFRS